MQVAIIFWLVEILLYLLAEVSILGIGDCSLVNLTKLMGITK